MPKTLINHTLGQNLSFVATPAVNSFERAQISSDSLSSRQGGRGSPLCGPSQMLHLTFDLFVETYRGEKGAGSVTRVPET